MPAAIDPAAEAARREKIAAAQRSRHASGSYSEAAVSGWKTRRSHYGTATKTPAARLEAIRQWKARKRAEQRELLLAAFDVTAAGQRVTAAFERQLDQTNANGQRARQRLGNKADIHPMQHWYRIDHVDDAPDVPRIPEGQYKSETGVPVVAGWRAVHDLRHRAAEVRV